MRLTPTPETAHVDPHRRQVDYSHHGAVAFAVVGKVVALAPRSTHTVIFNALKVVAEPQSANPVARLRFEESGLRAVFEDYGLEFFPALPTPEDLATFAKIDNELYARRRATLAGRAWSDVAVERRSVAILSFWVPRTLVSESTISLVVAGLGLTGEIWLEFADSQVPESRLFRSKHA